MSIIEFVNTFIEDNKSYVFLKLSKTNNYLTDLLMRSITLFIAKNDFLINFSQVMDISNENYE
jgi:hypothetical protein